MTQPLPLVSDDDDEPTQSYTQTQLQTMRTGFREPELRPEDFENFGNSGTPEGVLGSRNEACLQIVGTIGESFVEQIGSSRVAANQAPRPAPSNSGSWGELPDPERAAEQREVVEQRSWAPAQAEAAAAGSEVVIELGADASDSSGTGREAGNRRLWLLVAGPLALFGVLVLVLPSLRGGEQEPPRAAIPEPQASVEDVPALAGAEGVEDVEEEPEATPGEDVPVPPDLPPVKVSKKVKRKKPWETSRCRKVLDDADDASSAGKWKTVEKLTTKKKSCWEHEKPRILALVWALFQLEKYPECVRVAGRSSDPEIIKMRTRCQVKMQH